RQINPVNDRDGGEPGGNIRPIFLFRMDRGLSFVDRPGGDSTTPTTVMDVGGTAQLSFSPGRIDPTNTAWNSSRKPLAAEFVFNGNSQTLDHILVSGSLLDRSTLDVVHVNAEFADQASDHDPSVVRILMNDETTLCSLTQRVAGKDGVASSLCAKLANAAAA